MSLQPAACKVAQLAPQLTVVMAQALHPARVQWRPISSTTQRTLLTTSRQCGNALRRRQVCITNSGFQCFLCARSNINATSRLHTSGSSCSTNTTIKHALLCQPDVTHCQFQQKMSANGSKQECELAPTFVASAAGLSSHQQHKHVCADSIEKSSQHGSAREASIRQSLAQSAGTAVACHVVQACPLGADIEQGVCHKCNKLHYGRPGVQQLASWLRSPT